MQSSGFEHLYTQLNEISKFFKFGRKEIAKTIKSSIADLEKRTKDTEFELNINNEKLAKTESELSEAKTELQNLKTDILHLTTTDSSKNKYINELEANQTCLSIELKKTLQDYGSSEAERARLREQYNALNKAFSILNTKYKLTADVLSAKKVKNKALDDFITLANNEFIAFANEEASLAEEASAIIMMQNITTKLEIISNFPTIYNKNIAAVGGGFSAGKSEFISGFFRDANMKLPIGIKPVTAIPAYIVSGETDAVQGYSYKGGLIGISTELYKQFSHDFVKSFDFNLKDILPATVMETKIEHYANICFVDTPGYNPSNADEYIAEDFRTSREYLEEADVLLWVIGIDTNGTIPSSDLKFLEDLSMDNKQLYIIANKADLRGRRDIEKILDGFEEILNDYGLEYAGISAYNSLDKKEISFRKIALGDFLKSINRPTKMREQVLSELNVIFDMYETALNQDIEWTKDVKSHINSLELDLLESGYDNNDEKVAKRLLTIKNTFSTTHLETHISKLKSIKEMMIKNVEEIFDSIENQKG